jgi:hypothetical protein
MASLVAESVACGCGLQVDGGAAVEVVRAVLAERGHVPAWAAQAVREVRPTRTTDTSV